MPLITEIAVTRIAGTSRSRRYRSRCARGSAARAEWSSGKSRNFGTPSTITAPTRKRSRCRSRSSNQKTRSIQSRSFEATGGGQEERVAEDRPWRPRRRRPRSGSAGRASPSASGIEPKASTCSSAGRNRMALDSVPRSERTLMDVDVLCKRAVEAAGEGAFDDADSFPSGFAAFELSLVVHAGFRGGSGCG